MNVFITGGGGNIASIIKKNLKNINIINPTHDELDLLDIDQLEHFINNKQFDILIHTAIIGGRRTKEEDGYLVYKNILMFENLLLFSKHFRMIINLDSGAIYDRSTDILNRKESEIYTVPVDYYGFSKYMIYNRTLQYPHIFNLRIFNIFHLHEESDRFIKSCFLAKQNNKEITIFEDKYFDFFHETDFIRVINFYISQIENISSLPKVMNLCYKEKYTLSKIAHIIYPDTSKIKILSTTKNRNYCGNSNVLYDLPILLDGIENSILNIRNSLQENDKHVA